MTVGTFGNTVKRLLAAAALGAVALQAQAALTLTAAGGGSVAPGDTVVVRFDLTADPAQSVAGYYAVLSWTTPAVSMSGGAAGFGSALDTGLGTVGALASEVSSTEADALWFALDPSEVVSWSGTRSIDIELAAAPSLAGDFFSVSLGFLSVADEFGDDIDLGNGLNATARIAIEGGGTVPEPTTASLALLAAIGAYAARRRVRAIA